MKFLLLTILFAFGWNLAIAEDNPQWIRHQSISPDGQHIAFTYKGDLYRVPVSGGVARQLTFHEAHDFMAVWSNDGSQIAFASDRYGNFNVYVMDADGGPATRLTYHSNDEFPYAFSPDDGFVWFGAVRQDDVNHRQFPAASQPELYKVPVQGGRVHQVLTIPAEFSQISSDGKRVVYHDKKGGEDEWRKHHRSSITRDIWLYDREAGTHTMLSDFEGENRQPVFNSSEDAIYYLTDESGTFNVHKMDLSQRGSSEQITNFSLHPVRFLSYGSGRLAFGYDGELYTMLPGEEPQKVDVMIRTQKKSNPDSFISINGGVSEMAIAPNGKEIAFIARGEVFVTSVDGAMTKRITNTPEQERFLAFSPDGKDLLYSRKQDGQWRVFATRIVREEEPFFYGSTLLQEREFFTEDADVYQASFSPDGKQIAYIYDRRTLRVRNLDNNRTVDLLTPDDLFHMREGEHYFTWSPDSKWLLIGWRKLLHNSEVLLMAADGSERINLTRSGYMDSSPQWSNDGKKMIWFSNRDGLRSYATSGATERDVYTMFFDQEAWDLYSMDEEEYKLWTQVQEANGSSDEEEEDSDLSFDKERMKNWTARLTPQSGWMSDAVLSKDGKKLYYLASFDGRYNLWEVDLRTRENSIAIRLNSGPGSLHWDDDMSNLYMLSGGSIQKLNIGGSSASPVRIRGEMPFDELAERQHLFEHIYVRTKNVHYEPTFHGQDWDMLYEEYSKYLPHIGNTYEFAEMVAEWLGELNVSHSGTRYSRSIDNADQTASLGIFMDYSHEGNGIRIAEVIAGGPLDKASFDIQPGMVIEKINGQLITPDRDIAYYLNRKAGEFVMLEIVWQETRRREARKQITVRPISLGQERSLLYQRFIEINRKEVEEKSGGRLGYVHIPGMGDGPFRNVIQDMLGRYVNSEAMIVDTRFNGGGDLVADLAMFFTGVEFNRYATEDRVVGGEPTSRWTRPTLSLFNESMYSDGHCYASAYVELEIGPSVGMPVPGTCSFAGWERLPNGMVWGIVPVSATNKAGEWMENNQTHPTYEVKNMPGYIDQGRDQQLERAIEVLLEKLD